MPPSSLPGAKTISVASSARPSLLQGWSAVRDAILGARPITAKRRAVALAIALAADVLQLVLWPAFSEGAASPFDDALDLAVGAALWATLGMSTRLAAALAIELVPGADLFPTWTALVLSMPVAIAEPAAVVAGAHPEVLVSQA